VDTPRCVLCDRLVPEGGKQASVTPEARAMFERDNPGVDVEAVTARNVVCPDCLKLPADKRKRLVKKAMQRELLNYRASIARDLAKTN
jgi:hypothetical protein